MIKERTLKYQEENTINKKKGQNNKLSFSFWDFKLYLTVEAKI